MGSLQEMLRYYEENLDPEHIGNAKRRIRKTLAYERADRISLRVGFPCARFPGRPYSEEFNDMETMLYNQLASFQHAAEVKDDTLPMIRANYGVGILPSAFGLRCTILNNDLPWVERLDGEEEIRRLVDRGVPDERAGLMAKVLDTHEYYQEQLSDYPNCRECVPIYHPDFQGPFDIAHLIWGSEIYYAVYDRPELVHSLLELITETYIRFMRAVKRTIGDEDAPGCVYHWGTLYRGAIVLRDDSPVNLSRQMYEEFVRPYDERALAAFGGGGMHYCGRADQWVFSMMECRGLEALNFGQPPGLAFGFDFLEMIYDRAKEKRIPVVGYIMDKELVPGIPATGYAAGVTYQTGVADREEARLLLDRVGL